MTTSSTPPSTLKLLLPKGRLQDKVQDLLARVGLEFSFSTRSYRPTCSDKAVEAKVLKPQNIAPLLALGRHDCGFTGLDWVLEHQLQEHPNLEQVMDLGYNKVRIVAAIPEDLHRQPNWQRRKLVVASEYQTIAERYLAHKGYNSVLVKTNGATEALPPDDADMIIDNTSSGATLQMNRLVIIDELLQSTTRFFVSRQAMQDPAKREKLSQLQMLMQSALNADEKVFLEMNVDQAHFEALVAFLPCMRSPTVTPLYGEQGFAVKAAVPKKDVPRLLPELIQRGARDILEYRLEKIVLDKIVGDMPSTR